MGKLINIARRKVEIEQSLTFQSTNKDKRKKSANTATEPAFVSNQGEISETSEISTESFASAYRDPVDCWEYITERSAILECSGMSREAADARAFREWFNKFVGGEQ